MSAKRYAEPEIRALWRDVANWKWDPQTHGTGETLVVPLLREPNPEQQLDALDQLEFHLVHAGTDGLIRDSIVCEGIVVADEGNFAWVTRPYEFFKTRLREDGSHDVYRIDRSPAGDLIYCECHEPVSANDTEMRTATGPWSIQQFLDLDGAPALAKSIVRDLCVPRVVRP
jgi:hypothetical protein